MKKLLLLSFVLSINIAFGKLTNLEHSKLSIKYEKLRKYNKAINELLLIKNIKYPYLYYYRLAWLYYLSKKYKLSIKTLEKTFKYYPNSIESKLLLIRNYIALKEYRNALKISGSIIRIDYYNYYGNYYEALALNKIKDYKTSIKICLKMLYLYPTDVLFLKILADNYLKIKDFKNYNYIINILKFLN